MPMLRSLFHQPEQDFLQELSFKKPLTAISSENGTDIKKSYLKQIIVAVIYVPYAKENKKQLLVTFGKKNLFEHILYLSGRLLKLIILALVQPAAVHHILNYSLRIILQIFGNAHLSHVLLWVVH